MTPDEEFLSFDVVIHAVHLVDNRRAYVTTFNVIPLAANDP